MQLTLKNFDQVEDTETTEKGLQYYKDGAISYIEEVEDGEWDASVMGTQLYSVGVNLKKLKINATGCDCPAFEQNDYCKHIAAVLFAIRDKVSKEESLPKASKEKKSKVKTSSQLLHDALHGVEANDLKKFIESYAAQHKDFTNDVLLYFKLQSVVDDTSEEGFIEVVKSVVASSTKKNVIDAEALSKNLEPLIAQAQKYLNDTNYLEAFYIAKAIVGVLSPLLKNLSYIYRYAPNTVTKSLNVIENLSGYNIPPMFRDELFDYSLSLSESEAMIVYGYDKQIDELLLRLAGDVKSKEQILLLIDRKLQKIIPKGTQISTRENLNNHLHYVRYKVNLLNELNRETEANQLVRDNMYYHDDLVHEEIKKAVQNNDPAYIRQLINRKISGDTVATDFPYRRDTENTQWKGYYLDIAILENDLPSIVLYAETFFKTYQDIRYYDVLKKYYPKDKWNKKFEEIESSLFRKHYSFGILATIYVREGKLKDLFELLKKHAFLSNIRDTVPVLLPSYRSEVLTLYNRALISLLQHGTAGAYKETVDHLNYLISLGEKETVHDWIETFKSIYSNRPRFLKELDKLKALMT